jgi:biopolymer transport protein ExbD
LGPGLVARRILDHLSPEDFDLEYYRVSSLLTFYQIATPAEESLVEWFDSTEKKDLPVEVVSVYLDQENSIYVNATRVSTSEGEKIIYQILKRNPTQTVIEVTVAREALYDSFLQCREMIDAVYSKIESELGVVPKRIRYLEQSGPCQLDESP